MHYRNLVDTHIHSDNTKDAEHSVTLICEKAIQRGLRAIAITDHCECLDYESMHYAITCRQSAFETRKAGAVFNGQLVVSSGLELGCPVRNLQAVNDVKRNNFDFLLASVHRIKGKKKSFSHLDYSREDNKPALLFKRYLDDVIETVEWNGFDVLAHLTYPLRYFPPELMVEFDPLMYKNELMYILKTLAQNGRALEINTAGNNYVTASLSGSTHPNADIVKMFKSVGGEYLTVGSDAHSAYNVGRGIEDALDIAVESGFKYVTIYQNSTPLPITII